MFCAATFKRILAAGLNYLENHLLFDKILGYKMLSIRI